MLAAAALTETLPAVLGMEYLAAAGQPPSMTPHNDTHDSVCRHFIGGQVDEAWPDLLQDVLLVHLLMACTPLLVEAHDAKEKARATSNAIEARFQNCLQQLQRLTHDERLAYLQQITRLRSGSTGCLGPHSLVSTSNVRTRSRPPA